MSYEYKSVLGWRYIWMVLSWGNIDKDNIFFMLTIPIDRCVIFSPTLVTNGTVINRVNWTQSVGLEFYSMCQTLKRMNSKRRAHQGQRTTDCKTPVAMWVQTDWMKDRYNHSVFPLGYQVVPKEREEGFVMDIAVTMKGNWECTCFLSRMGHTLQ